MRFLIGLTLIVIGFLLTWKADWLVNNWGRIEWAEVHLSSDGGTRMLYKLMGIILILGAFLYMTGALQTIVGGIFGGLFSGSGIGPEPSADAL
ncbi:MAG: hypothetical protein HYZ09_01605 [Candidatus Kerfeldbacteria bacterium]|nr:hypothetical protein [Candidatus Kerfeldbacteria bacterium]